MQYMTYLGLRTPVVILFTGPIVFQLFGIGSLFLSPFFDIISSTFEKLFLGFMLLTFFSLLREFVFFETLFQTDCAHNMPMFHSGTSQDGLETMTQIGASSSGL